MDSTPNQITHALADLVDGRREAADQLLTLVYDELRSLAAAHLRDERKGHTLQPTALVHEAYLRLIGQTEVNWQSKAHFFAVAATVIRRVLVDHARRTNAAKRGGDYQRTAIELANCESTPDQVDLPNLDYALDKLAKTDERKSRVVELRYFAGLSIPETAEVLGVSHATIERDWRLARAWLYDELKRDDINGT